MKAWLFNRKEHTLQEIQSEDGEDSSFIATEYVHRYVMVSPGIVCFVCTEDGKIRRVRREPKDS